MKSFNFASSKQSSLFHVFFEKAVVEYILLALLVCVATVSLGTGFRRLTTIPRLTFKIYHHVFQVAG